MPDTADAYTHRVGRTGRAEHEGEALTLAQPEDEIMVREIEKVLGEPLERRRLDGFNYEGFNPEPAEGQWERQAAPGPRMETATDRTPAGQPTGGGRRSNSAGRGRSQR